MLGEGVSSTGVCSELLRPLCCSGIRLQQRVCICRVAVAQACPAEEQERQPTGESLEVCAPEHTGEGQGRGADHVTSQPSARTQLALEGTQGLGLLSFLDGRFWSHPGECSPSWFQKVRIQGSTLCSQAWERGARPLGEEPLSLPAAPRGSARRGGQ